MKFYYIYKALAHPETNGYVAPFTLEERLMHVKEAERTLGSEFSWICDTMENDLKHALGDAPNSEFIIDPDGKVAVQRRWSKPDELRKDLERLVGAVDEPTTIADLNLHKQSPPKVAASGVVPRIKVAGRMRPLKIEPDISSAQPFYVKLRAEVDDPLMRDGKGKIYLGFHLDPLYHVHWNNLAAPLAFEVKTASGVCVTPASGEAPKVEAEADVDPREFLLDIEKEGNAQSLEVTVKYFACNDEQGWCKPVSQTYTVYLQLDSDGGSARRGNKSRRPPGASRGSQGPRGRAEGGPRPMGMIVSVDAANHVLTVRMRSGVEQELFVPESAQLMQNGQRIQLEALQRNDRVMFRVDAEKKDDSGRAHVTRVMSRR